MKDDGVDRILVMPETSGSQTNANSMTLFAEGFRIWLETMNVSNPKLSMPFFVISLVVFQLLQKQKFIERKILIEILVGQFKMDQKTADKYINAFAREWEIIPEFHPEDKRIKIFVPTLQLVEKWTQFDQKFNLSVDEYTKCSIQIGVVK